MTQPLFERFTTRFFPKILLFAGVLSLIWSFVTGPQNLSFNGYRLIASGIVFLGIGEWLNHPRQKALEFTSKDNEELRKKTHYKRNPSSIGNLFEITALLLICVGISKAFLN